jgi:hypothetical protein
MEHYPVGAMTNEQIDARTVWKSNRRLWFRVALVSLGLSLSVGLVTGITSASAHVRWIASGVMTTVLLALIVLVARVTIRRARGASKDDLNAWFDWDMQADKPWIIGLVVLANGFLVLLVVLALLSR